jgi:hypothetical protein
VSQTGSAFASASAGATVLGSNGNATTVLGQNAATRDAASILIVSFVAGAVGFAGLFIL